MTVNRYRRTVAPAALLLAAAVGLAGCAGSPRHKAAASSPPSSSLAMPGMTTSPGPSGTGAPVSGNTVTIRNFAFAPATLKVTVGTTVTWTNRDTDAHTVTSQQGGGPLRSAPLNTGQSYEYTFTKAGTYPYLCTIHPFMTGAVEVTG